MLNDDVARWKREIIENRGKKDSPFSADAELHLINVSLRDIKDRHLRQSLLQVPTAFTITPDYVEQLQAAGRDVLRQSPNSNARWKASDNLKAYRDGNHTCCLHSHCFTRRFHATFKRHSKITIKAQQISIYQNNI
jgi:hypothetical protein